MHLTSQDIGVKLASFNKKAIIFETSLFIEALFCHRNMSTNGLAAKLFYRG